jgi:hypothetical protein
MSHPHHSFVDARAAVRITRFERLYPRAVAE